MRSSRGIRTPTCARIRSPGCALELVHQLLQRVLAAVHPSVQVPGGKQVAPLHGQDDGRLVDARRLGQLAVVLEVARLVRIVLVDDVALVVLKGERGGQRVRVPRNIKISTNPHPTFSHLNAIFPSHPPLRLSHHTWKSQHSVRPLPTTRTTCAYSEKEKEEEKEEKEKEED